MPTYMTPVQERRQKQCLRLTIPPVKPADLWNDHNLSPSSFSSTNSNSHSDDPISTLLDLEKLEVLGHGSGGTVYKVRHKTTGQFYALKSLRLGKQTDFDTQEQAMREAEILRRLDSKFVVACYGVFSNFMENCGGAAGGDICFLMEFMEGGSLHGVLREGRRLSEEAISAVARGVLKGLSYLHGMHVVHRDIKPSNLLMNKKGEIKIADFGVSRLGITSIKDCDSCTGTCAYMSPERIDPEKWNGEYSDGFSGDIWALGMVLLECYLGHFPLINKGQKLDWVTIMCAICFEDEKMEMPKTASPELQSFIQRCLEKDWRLRGTVEELLRHPFVAAQNSWFAR